MPEITAVQYMTENLHDWLIKDPIVSVDILSSANQKRIDFEHFKMPTGIPIDVFRRGKNSVVVYQQGCLVLRYQLSGKIVQASSNTPPSFARVRFLLQSGNALYWVDKINFGQLHWVASKREANTLFATLGPEFWPQKKTAAWWKQRIKGKKAIHKILIDQKVVAGIGNIIAIEALYRSKIHPTTHPNALQESDWTALAKNIHLVVNASHQEHNQRRQQEKERGIFLGSLPLVSEGHRKATGFQIYGRQDMLCPQCKEANIEKSSLGSRPIYLCPLCQKPTKGQKS